MTEDVADAAHATQQSGPDDREEALGAIAVTARAARRANYVNRWVLIATVAAIGIVGLVLALNRPLPSERLTTLAFGVMTICTSVVSASTLRAYAAGRSRRALITTMAFSPFAITSFVLLLLTLTGPEGRAGVGLVPDSLLFRVESGRDVVFAVGLACLAFVPLRWIDGRDPVPQVRLRSFAVLAFPSLLALAVVMGASFFPDIPEETGRGVAFAIVALVIAIGALVAMWAINRGDTRGQPEPFWTTIFLLGLLVSQLIDAVRVAMSGVDESSVTFPTGRLVTMAAAVMAVFGLVLDYSAAAAGGRAANAYLAEVAMVSGRLRAEPRDPIPVVSDVLASLGRILHADRISLAHVREGRVEIVAGWTASDEPAELTAGGRSALLQAVESGEQIVTDDPGLAQAGGWQTNWAEPLELASGSGGIVVSWSMTWDAGEEERRLIEAVRHLCGFALDAYNAEVTADAATGRLAVETRHRETLLEALAGDIREPILWLAEGGASGGSDEALATTARRIVRAIDDVLLVHQLAAGTLEVDPEPVDVADLVASVGVHGVDVQATVPAGTAVLADRRLADRLVAAVVEAATHSWHTTVTVTARREHGQVALRVGVSGAPAPVPAGGALVESDAATIDLDAAAELARYSGGDLRALEGAADPDASRPRDLFEIILPAASS